jgi:AraC-like DNA-binding protein
MLSYLPRMLVEAHHQNDTSGAKEWSCDGLTVILISRRSERERVRELTNDRPTVYASLEEVGGRTELRPSCHRSKVAHGGAHASFVPAGVEAWEWSGPITLHRHLKIQFYPPSLPSAIGGELERIDAAWMREDPSILRCCTLLAQVLDGGSPRGRFFSAVATAMIAGFSEVRAPNRRGLAPKQLRMVQDFLTANLSADVKMSELAARAGQSESYFVRSFKASTGIPPYKWQLKLRIEKAKSLMLEGVPLAQAAVAVGFANQSHLTRTFRNLTGITPAEWRRMHRMLQPKQAEF